ncbi:MAG: MurR/RpiR family transcriptional regulator [Lactococcus lactis]|nr:MurR/RpiR family transcriptional regulator [Lactococcus lactis]
MLADILDDELISTLNTNELFILQYLYAHSGAIEGLTIRQLAKQLSCSTTTILRFCQKINLSGYNELKYHIKNYTTQTDSSILSYKNQLTEQEFIQDIENTLLLLKEYDVNRVIAKLKSSQNIHLFSGAGITGRVLEYLEKMMFSYGIQNVYRYESSTLAFHVAEKMTDQDVLFVISSSGKYAPVLKLANLAKTQQATVIAITPFSDNVLASIADVSFRFFGHEQKNKDTEFTSRLPLFYIIDTIFETYRLTKEGREY